MLVHKYLAKHHDNFCNDGQRFVKAAESPKKAWATCPRGDWMIWFISYIGISPTFSPLAIYKYFKARFEFEIKTASESMRESHDRLLKSLEVFGEWCTRMLNHDMPLLTENEIRKMCNDYYSNQPLSEAFRILSDTIRLSPILAEYLISYYLGDPPDSHALRMQFTWAETHFNGLFKSRLVLRDNDSEWSAPCSHSTIVGADAVRAVVPWSAIQTTIQWKAE